MSGRQAKEPQPMARPAGAEADFDACKQLGLQPTFCDNFDGEVYCADENCKLVGPCALAADGSIECP